MEVELVAKDCIKPSSPTPHHLKGTKMLSLLDQLAPAVIFPILLVYPLSPQQVGAKTVDDLVVSRRTLLLKQSLSQTLTHFYPLAGTITDQVSVDCNDEGAYYVEGRVQSPLSDHLNQLEAGLVYQLLVKDTGTLSRSPVTMVQQTNFACGGVVIVTTVSHRAADAASFTCFLKAWASIARGLDHEAIEHLYPNFDSEAAIFWSHHKQELPRELSMIETFSHRSRTRLITSRRFVFDVAAITRLKAQAAGLSLENPTRVEVVSALLWRRLAAVFKERRSGGHKPSGILHAVNLRRRATQIFSDSSPGNICLWATSVRTCDQDPDLSSLASQVREATSKINGEIAKEVTGARAFAKICEMMKEILNEFSDHLDIICFSSWCNFGHYDIDFGWGKPIKAGFLVFGRIQKPFPFESFVNLMDTRTGKGVEATVMLEEQDMMLLEHDQELLSYAAMDPIISLPC